MSNMSHADQASRLRAYEAAGWSVRTGSSHYVATCPCGQHRTTLSFTKKSQGYTKRTPVEAVVRRCPMSQKGAA